MTRKIGLVLTILVAISATGCASITGKKGMFRDRTKNYLTATSIAPLKFPSGVDSNQVMSYYPVPSASNQTQVEEVSILPPDLWPSNAKPTAKLST